MAGIVAKLNVAEQHAGDNMFRRQLGRDEFNHFTDQGLLDFTAYRVEDVIAALKVIVEGAARHAGGRHQVVDAAGFEAFFRNQGNGRVDNGSAGSLPLARRGSGGCLHGGPFIAC